MSKGNVILKISDLSMSFGTTLALDSVTFEIAQGEVLAVIGSNGAGKSTLLRTIAGLHQAAKGQVIFENRNIKGQAPSANVKAGVSLCPEGRMVFSKLSVFDNLRLGGWTKRHLSRPETASDLDFCLRLFPVLKERENQLAGTLSGGEQQMLALSRALMCRPRLLLLDEPSLGLAPLIANQIMTSIAKIAQLGCAVLLVEQNAKAALSVANRGIVLENGRVKWNAESAALLANQDLAKAYFGMSE